eukprot:TRINITY_DN5507_c0_g1_i4.p1 TRINITY_DN5507_c0_g1~~TRINITY_DN5507_c0_g1_i4.p1  ORF type:complete len:100 (-),score=13.63 TRINITY_DN5507_c0_g1_i4:123-422(-)
MNHLNDSFLSKQKHNSHIRFSRLPFVIQTFFIFGLASPQKAHDSRIFLGGKLPHVFLFLVCCASAVLSIAEERGQFFTSRQKERNRWKQTLQEIGNNSC